MSIPSLPGADRRGVGGLREIADEGGGAILQPQPVQANAGPPGPAGREPPVARRPKLQVVSIDFDWLKWEGDWISWLLSDFEVEHLCDPGLRATPGDMVLILAGDTRPRTAEIHAYLERGRQLGAKVVLIHLSDEWLSYPTEHYGQVDVVFRTYWRPGVMRRSRFIPLGYPSGMQATAEPPPISSRHHLWAFAGEVKQRRQRMLTAVRRLGPGFEHLTSKWEDEKALSKADYAQMLANTVFAPCPTGNHSPESFRLYEALEAGCIPIVEEEGGAIALAEALAPASLLRIQPWRDRRWRDVGRKALRRSYWLKPFPGFPVPRIAHWENLPRLVDRIDVESTAAEVSRWWRDLKARTKAEVSATIAERLFAPGAGVLA